MFIFIMQRAQGEKTQLKIYKNDSLVFMEKITLENQQFKRKIFLEVNKKGIHHFKVKVDSIENELTVLNNQYDFYINGLESNLKVDIVYSAPHPDVKNISRSLEKINKYQVSVLPSNKYPIDSLQSTNLLILHGISGQNNSLYKEARKLQKPVWLILTTTSDWNHLNGLEGIRSKSTFNKDRANGVVNESFTFFSLDEHKETIQSLPPVQIPFGKIELPPAISPLITASIGGVETNQVIVALGENNFGKIAFWIGDGLWRWRVFEFVKNNNFNATDALIQKIVTYLVAVDPQKTFDVFTNSKVYEQGESVVVNAHVFNKNGELVEGLNPRLRVKNKESQFDFEFYTLKKQYQYKILGLKEGDYSYTASVEYEGSTKIEKGSFTIRKGVVEALNLKANTRFLSDLSILSKGTYFPKFRKETLKNELENNIELKAKIEFIEHSSLLLDWKFLLVIWGILYFVEWVIRKREGV